MSLINLLFSAKGRIGPERYWAGFAILSAVSIAVLFVPVAGGWLWLASLAPWAMLTAKRLHDMNLSGWVQLVAVAANLGIVLAGLGLLGAAVYLTLFTRGPREVVQAGLDAGGAAGAVSTLLLTGGLVAFNTFWLIWLGGTPGSRDENRYGRPPHWVK